MIHLWLFYTPFIISWAVMTILGLWGALRARRDILKAVRAEDEEETPDD